MLSVRIGVLLMELIIILSTTISIAHKANDIVNSRRGQETTQIPNDVDAHYMYSVGTYNFIVDRTICGLFYLIQWFTALVWYLFSKSMIILTFPLNGVVQSISVCFYLRFLLELFTSNITEDSLSKRRPKRRFKSGKNKGLLPFRRHRSMKQHLLQIAVVLIALWLYKQYYKSSVYCKNPSDPLCTDKYFSDNYAGARHKFLSLSNTIHNANTYHLPIYELEDGTYLYTDITIINEDSSSNHLMIHLSGTHGVEGHAGSAIQIALLEYISNITNNQAISPLFENYSFSDISDDAPIIMFVHALNPYGFHFRRRVNENNVDLNRNYKTKEEWEDLVTKDHNAFGYMSLNAFFNPKYDLKYVIDITDSLPSSKFMRGVYIAWYYWSIFVYGAYYIITVGISGITSALVTGQWFDPNGMQYNGEPFKLEKSHVMLRDFFEDKMFVDKHPEWNEQINKISFIDVHTGLGPYGLDTIVGARPLDVEKLKVLLPQHVAQGLLIDAHGFMDAGYKHVYGLTSEHINVLVNSKLRGKEMDNLLFVQEFGTYNKVWVGAGFRLENAITNAYNEYIKDNNNDDDMIEKMDDILNISRMRFRKLFYVEYVDWKEEIVKRGFTLFKRTYHR